MARCVILILLGFVAAGSCASVNTAAFVPKWIDFKSTHGKSYESTKEEAKRFQIFVDNHRQIEEHNNEFKAGRQSFEQAMNKFGDLTNEEFRARMNGYKRKADSNLHDSTFVAPENVQIPDEVDWRPKGYVTPVKDQGQCGSCWAFSATGSLEGQNFHKTGKLVSLSEQNLVDCSGKFGNEGCNGGLMDQAFAYIKSNDGIDTESSYPYEATDDRCRFNKSNIGADDTGSKDIKHGDESALEAAILAIGPISVAIDASRSSFQFYKSGIYYESKCSSTQLDHGVLAAGFGTLPSGEQYYIVKNSWGPDWGDHGYILMARNKKNNCGIATDASYPLV